MDALPAFELLRPTTLGEVVKARADHPESTILGGGTDLVVNIRRGIVADSIARIMDRTGRSEAEARAELAKHNPQRRLVQPAEVAAAVLALCGASAINGQAIAVDGGET